MYIGLIKKDIFVVLRNNFGITLIQMIFILVIISMNLGSAGYVMLVSAFAWSMMLNTNVNEKNNNTYAFLTALPYERKDIVKAKYISLYLVFIVVSLIYEAIAVVTNILNINIFEPLSLRMVLTALMSYSIFIGLSIPLYFKFDDIIVRIFSIFFICTAGMSLSMLNESYFMKTQASFIYRNMNVFCIVISIVSLIASISVSNKMFEKLEL